MFDFGDRPETSQQPRKDTPPDLEVSSAIRFVQSDLQTLSDAEDLVVNCPLKSELLEFITTLPQSLEIPMDRPGPSIPPGPKKISDLSKRDSDVSSESSGTDEAGTSKIFTEDYNPKDFDNLDVPPEIKQLFENIVRYTPQKFEIEYKLQPFIPEYVPAVGDIDAFLKVLPPAIPETAITAAMRLHLAGLGLKVLDEPCGNQTDPALLHMKLRSTSTVTGALIAGPPPGIAKNARDIDRWISEMQAIHVSRSQQQTINSNSATLPAVADIDTLMSEWPQELEQALDVIGLPSPSLDCSLTLYIEIICTLLDIPIGRERTQADFIKALNTLFNLYSAVRNL